MSINPGKMDRRIVIQVKTTTRGAAGGTVVAWADERVVWAEKVSETSTEGRRMLALRAEATVIFRIRYLSTLTTRHRIYFEGQYHDILGDPVEEGRREMMLVTAKRVEALSPA